MLGPPLVIRAVIWSGDMRVRTSLRSGPRLPPYPAIWWQYSQPFSWNSLAPSSTAGSSVRTTEAGSGVALKSGDQSARSPAIQKVAIVVHMKTTSSGAQGRCRARRTPVLDSGSSSSAAPKTSGPSTMMRVSRFWGASARSAKYQRKYQSGRG